VLVGKRDPYLPYIFRSSSEANPISNFKSFEYAPGGLTIVDTQGFSFQDPENIYIAFRGTEIRPRDILTDLSATSTSFPFGPGTVHSGFSDAFAAVVPQLTEFLSNCDKSKNVILCGHSLGGALATLCAAWVRQTTPRQVMLYTFGSPRVGCRDFVEHYSKTASFPAFRVANPTDIVPSVPWDTAGGDLDKFENSLVVMENPRGWILADLKASSETMRYQHFGTPVSLRSPGYTIVDSPAAMDGEFAHGVRSEWRWMSLKEFVGSRIETNIRHHYIDEYLRLLWTDFHDDCRNWAHGDPAPFQRQLQQVNADLADLGPQIVKEQVTVYAPHPIAEPDASGTAFSRRSDMTSPDRLKALELQRSQLQFQADTLRLRAQGATAEERNASLLRLTRRPMDKSLNRELLYQADAK